MNKKAVVFGGVYSALVIALKLLVVLTDLGLSRFGYFYLNITCALLLLPFYYLTIKMVRDRENGGSIGGREAARLALTVFAIGAITGSIYNYVQYEWKDKDMAIEYYHSAQYLEYLKAQPNIKAEQYNSIIEKDIKIAEGAAFAATTGKLFGLLVIGISGAFIMASVLKKRPTTQAGSLK